MTVNYYKTLEVAENATHDEIKKAYRKLARKYHPDVSREVDASEKIKAINEAYQVLGDVEKKKQYDHERRGPSAQPFNWPPSSAGSGFQDFNTIFQSHFRERNFKRSQIELDLPLSLERVFKGGPTPVQVQGQSLSVDLPAGVEDGSSLQFSHIFNGKEADVVLNIFYQPHPQFSVEAGHVFSTLLLRPWQSGPGTTLPIDTLAGKVQLQIPPGISSGQKLRLKGRGMPRKSGQAPGDHFVIIQIQAPSPQTEEQVQIYSDMKKLFNA